MLSRNENLLKITSLVYAFLFTGAVLVFIFLPGQLFEIINHISVSVAPALPPAPDTGKFWLSMTISMMATIITLSLMMFRHPGHYYMMALPLVVAKFASSFFGLAFFVSGFFHASGDNTLANLIIFVTDFPLGVFMLVVWKRVWDEKIRG